MYFRNLYGVKKLHVALRTLKPQILGIMFNKE